MDKREVHGAIRHWNSHPSRTKSYIYIVPASFSFAMDKFILFGDSITQQSFSQQNGFAFGAALSDEYVRRLDVVK